MQIGGVSQRWPPLTGSGPKPCLLDIPCLVATIVYSDVDRRIRVSLSGAGEHHCRRAGYGLGRQVGNTPGGCSPGV